MASRLCFCVFLVLLPVAEGMTFAKRRGKVVWQALVPNGVEGKTPANDKGVRVEHGEHSLFHFQVLHKLFGAKNENFLHKNTNVYRVYFCCRRCGLARK